MQLFIHALEGGFYVVNLVDENQTENEIQKNVKKSGIEYKPFMQFRSLFAIKHHFSKLATKETWLIHNNAYDQMIGLPSSVDHFSQQLKW